MKFKVGDKVRCIIGYHEMLIEGKVYVVSKISSEGWLNLEEDWRNHQWGINQFELVQPEPQVGDVWANADKSIVAKIVGEFINFGFTRCFTVVYLKGIKKGRGETFDDSNFGKDFPILLQRKPKKQPKPVAETPKKQKEEVWEPVIKPGINPHKCFRKGNKIKWITYGKYEGIATCHKNDKFDLSYGIDLAWCRAQIKYHEAKIAEMLGKEGAK